MSRINDQGIENLPTLEDDTPPEAKLLKSQTYGPLAARQDHGSLARGGSVGRISPDIFSHPEKAPSPGGRPVRCLLTAILADAFNLGLEKMAEACPGTSLSKLAWLVAWHIRDEFVIRKGLAELVKRHPAQVCRLRHTGGEGNHNRRAMASGFRGPAGTVNPPATANAKYGSEPGVLFLYPSVRPVRAVSTRRSSMPNVRDANPRARWPPVSRYPSCASKSTTH